MLGSADSVAAAGFPWGKQPEFPMGEIPIRTIKCTNTNTNYAERQRFTPNKLNKTKNHRGHDAHVAKSSPLRLASCYTTHPPSCQPLHQTEVRTCGSTYTVGYISGLLTVYTPSFYYYISLTSCSTFVIKTGTEIPGGGGGGGYT